MKRVNPLQQLAIQNLYATERLHAARKIVRKLAKSLDMGPEEWHDLGTPDPAYEADTPPQEPGDILNSIAMIFQRSDLPGIDKLELDAAAEHLVATYVAMRSQVIEAKSYIQGFQPAIDEMVMDGQSDPVEYLRRLRQSDERYQQFYKEVVKTCKAGGFRLSFDDPKEPVPDEMGQIKAYLSERMAINSAPDSESPEATRFVSTGEATRFVSTGVING